MAKQRISVNLYTDELIYEVLNKSYLTGRSQQEGKDIEQAANMQASEDEEDKNQISRSIQRALSVVHNSLAEYIDNPPQQPDESVDEYAADNTLLDTDSNSTITVNINMPSNFNTSMTDSVAQSIHSFIVFKALAEWFAITNDSEREKYEAMAQECLAVIRSALNRRLRPAYKPRT
jgi:hypothetical protein